MNLRVIFTMKTFFLSIRLNLLQSKSRGLHKDHHREEVIYLLTKIYKKI